MANDPSHPDSNPGPADAAPTPKPPGTPEPVRGVEDAGAQALSEALRSTSAIVKFLMFALVAAFIFSGVFTVKPNEVAVKLRLGKPIGVGAGQLLKPGLHWNCRIPSMMWCSFRWAKATRSNRPPAGTPRRRRTPRLGGSPRPRGCCRPASMVTL